MKLRTYPILQIVVPLGVLLVTVAAAFPFAQSRRSLYETQARVWIQAQVPNNNGGQQDSGLYLPFMTFFNSPIQTASEIIRSGEVVHEAAEILKRRYPDQKRPDEGEIAAGLTATSIKDTDILLVKYLGSNPARATAVLQAVIDGFMEISSKQSSASATNERAFLETQVKEARIKLDFMSRKVERFQKEHNISSMEHDIVDLSKEAADMRHTVYEDKIELEKKESQVASMEEQVSNLQPGEGNETLARTLETRLGDQQVRLMESHGLRDGHPYIVKLKKSIQLTQKMLNQAHANSMAGSWANLNEKLTEERRELPKLRAQLSGHQRLLEVLETRVAKLPSEAVEWAELDREKQLSTQTVSEAERRLHSASLMESVSQRATNIKIIDKPAVPNMPTGPSKKLTLAIAAVVGFVLAVVTFLGMYQFNPIITRAQQVILIFGLPLAGIFNHSQKAAANHINVIRRALKKKIGDRKRIIISSADPGDGKTTLASALAVALANNGEKVALFDASPGDNALAKRFEVASSPGLTEYSSSPNEFNPVYQVMDNLVLVPYGQRTVNFNLFENPAIMEMIHRLETEGNLIIFDTPAATQSSQALALAEEDQALLVLAVRLNATRKSSLSLLAAQLEKRVPLLVLTDAKETDLLQAPISKPSEPQQSAAGVPEEQAVW